MESALWAFPKNPNYALTFLPQKNLPGQTRKRITSCWQSQTNPSPANPGLRRSQAAPLPPSTLAPINPKDASVLKMLGGRSEYFQFFCSGEGEGAVRGDREGGAALIENPRRGGGFLPGEGGPGGCLQGACGGELNIFFRGRNARQEYYGPRICSNLLPP